MPDPPTQWGEPAPTAADPTLPIVHELVRADLLSRLEFGVAKYGTPLRPRNGRNALKDAYEEALDQCVYLRQMLWEQEHPTDGLREIVAISEELGLYDQDADVERTDLARDHLRRTITRPAQP